MYELIVIACLLNQPAKCEEFYLPFQQATDAVHCAADARVPAGAVGRGAARMADPPLDLQRAEGLRRRRPSAEGRSWQGG